MKAYISWMNSMPKWVKIIIAFPFLDILWNLYRVFVSACKKDYLGMVLGIILVVIGIPVIWIIDIIFICINGKIWWID